MAVYTVAFRSTDTGLSLNAASFIVFQKLSNGAAPTNAAPVTVTEVGYGVYKFTYVAAEEVVFVLDGGASIPAADRYARGVMAPTDTHLDVAVSTRASQATMDSAATQAGLDAVNVNVAMLDSRVQVQQQAIDTLYQYQGGRWKIHTTGPDANRIVYYADDGVTIVAKFDLKDISGNPTHKGAYERVRV